METCISPSIIMRVKEFGESDLLVYFFTPDKGRLKGVAKGAQRSRKRFVNCLDVFSLVNLEYNLKSRENLHFIQSGKLVNAYPGLRSDYSILFKASFMIELTEILFPSELPDRGMFEILKESFHLLSEGENTDSIPIIFEVMAMSMGGYGINLEKCCICGRKYLGEGAAVCKPERGGIACLKCQHISETSPGISPDTAKTIGLMQSRSIRLLKELNLSDEIVSEIRPALKLHREYHLGKRLKTASFLE